MFVYIIGHFCVKYFYTDLETIQAKETCHINSCDILGSKLNKTWFFSDRLGLLCFKVLILSEVVFFSGMFSLLKSG